MKKLWQYLYYFFNSLKNRGVGFTFRLLLEEWRGEKKAGIKSLQIENLDAMQLKQGRLDETHHYQGASYFIVKRILKDLDVKLQEKELIDIGCGKGRVLIVAAETGFTKLRGIEIARELCDSALENIGLIKNKFPNAHFVIEHLNAIDYTPSPDAGVFFLFNPFPEKVMVKVAERISEHCKNYPESRIIYVNPKFAACFLEKGFTIEKEMRSKKYSEAIILRMK